MQTPCFTEEEKARILVADPPPGISEKGAIGWRELRGISRRLHDENRDLRAHAETLKARVKTLETKCAISAITVEDLKKSLREMTDAQSAFLEEIRA